MSNSDFDIIFRGDIVFGHQLSEVKVKLQQLFKVDAAKIDALFTGRPVPLKRNLDEATANKYRDVLLKAGAMVEVCSSHKSPANSPSKPAVPVRSQPMAPIARVAPAYAAWTLAPVGADLLPASERPAKPAAVAVDTSGLSLRPAEGNLVDTAEVRHEREAVVIAPDLGLAAIGEDLIGADEKLELPLVEIELEDWGIADAGSDLLSAAERPVVVPVAVANSDFGLAPAGSDLGQLRVSVKPVIPDISKLRLAE
ncbi:hypothetical protein D0C16_14575 [Cellvibrio sp. KY-GH-1]|uniref:hypothetical protein n=1 Tax=Cellvibrio sp. KY-GH-1 TaxID=2303332 RepID=UPI0012445D16|nr:hypothetical protein [Cellvibrio sp. KY-GH-1]QEY17094.1 hypothetical protein D0C16_14575 [Cellvibrio sp. KY-GH-1]